MIRTAKKWSQSLGIPGGKIKWGETSEARARREIKEENKFGSDGYSIRLCARLYSFEGILYRDGAFCL